jgi:hypothetical protein
MHSASSGRGASGKIRIIIRPILFDRSKMEKFHKCHTINRYLVSNKSDKLATQRKTLQSCILIRLLLTKSLNVKIRRFASLQLN